MTTSQIHANQEILGYLLQARIGAGGFGEVWKATAPGGMPKAVKIVFGYHDDKRAQAELKALKTVTELRHPFLMSLERIDIFEGQLVVVSELADRSLKDRFNECARQGMPGIPRDELIQYLRDAADGLDYLCNKHLLQHLDVKPENLLLVGEHVKVGDYGLVKDIRESAQSIMGGMTPTHAAPEIFDGRPSQLSDQYSLAIVYQEMLTGVRPFNGSTPAELARQHMLGRPNLDPLPRGDQSVVAKALSKDPTNRYQSCSAFVKELTRRRNKSVPRPTDNGALLPDFGSCPPDGTMVLTSSELPKKRSSAAAKRLPPTEVDGTQAAFHPTLMIGVGRTGALALQFMKERLYGRFGRTDELPALHMLCLDTDLNDLCSITNSDERARFREDEILPIALQNPDVYRKMGDRFSKWLSRRWVFNIPRSLTTEGIRPLGRLAFADHCNEIVERLHQICTKLADQNALKQSSSAVKLAPNPEPRVFIVGSISGGVGSGMIADLAYAIRSVLLEHGLSDRNMTGMLLHGSGKATSDGGLAHANAYSCLRELYHYGKLGYPGDESLGITPFDGEAPAAFSDTYLIHCGSDDYEDHAAAVADYLYLDVATGCNDFYKRCRTGRNDDGQLRLRTFGISRLDLQQERTRVRFAAFLQARMFTEWLHDNESTADTINTDEFVEDLFRDNEVSTESVLQYGNDISRTLNGNDLEKRLTRIAHSSGRRIVPEQRNRAMSDAIDKALSTTQSHNEPMLPGLKELMTHPTKTLTSGMWTKVARLIDIPNVRLSGAELAYRKCLSKFDTIQAQIDRHLKHLSEKFASESPFSAEVMAKMKQQEATLVCASQLVASMKRSSGDLLHEFDVVRELLETSRTLADEAMKSKVPPLPSGPDYGRVVAGFLNKHVGLFVNKLETNIERKFVQSMGGLRRLARNTSNAAQFAEAIHSEARQLVAGSFHGLNFDAVMQSVDEPNTHTKALLKKRMKSALPRLIDCGGAVRMMVAVPTATNAVHLKECVTELYKETPTIVRGSDGDVAVCFECEGVSAENVALLLVEERPESSEYIARIASRLDVEWMPLTGLG